MARSYDARQVIEDDQLRAMQAANQVESQPELIRRKLIESLVDAGLLKLQTEPGVFFPGSVEELSDGAADGYEWIVSLIDSCPENFSDDELSAILAEASDRITDRVGEEIR